MPTFTHLQVHSHFSLLGGTAAPAELVRRAASAGFSHLALTDNNALYGAVIFAKACRAAGIEPIIGMTVRVAAPAEDGGLSGAAGAGRLVLLATGAAGYRSLCRLSAVLQGRPDREAIVAQGVTWETLAACNEGLICLSGGQQGWCNVIYRPATMKPPAVTWLVWPKYMANRPVLAWNSAGRPTRPRLE